MRISVTREAAMGIGGGIKGRLVAALVLTGLLVTVGCSVRLGGGGNGPVEPTPVQVPPKPESQFAAIMAAAKGLAYHERVSILETLTLRHDLTGADRAALVNEIKLLEHGDQVRLLQWLAEGPRTAPE